MHMRLVALLAAAALTSTSIAVTTCPVSVQSRTTSTLTDPITEVVISISSGSGSSSVEGASSSLGSGSGSDIVDAGGSQDGQTAEVGSSSGSFGAPPTNSSSVDQAGSNNTTAPTTTTGNSSGNGTDKTQAGEGGTGGTNTPSGSGNPTSPSTTTTTNPPPSSSTETPPSSTSDAPSTTVAVTVAPVTSTDSASSVATSATTGPTPDVPETVSAAADTTTTPSGSNTGAGLSPSLGIRKLQTTTTATATVDPALGTSGMAGSMTGATGTTDKTNVTTTPGAPTNGPPVTAGMAPTTGSSSTNSSVGSNLSSGSDTLLCDSTFYSKWDAMGLKCGGAGIDVASAVAASSCVIYSGRAGSTSGSSCVSICSFPACTDDAWVYGANNGISSSIYDGLGVEAFLPGEVVAALEERSPTVSTFLSDSTLSDSEQCSYSSENSFSSCSCSAMLIDLSSSGSVAEGARKELRQQNEANGVITKDTTSTTGTVVAATSKSVAGVTVAVTGIAAIASAAVGGVSSAGASFAAAGSTMAITTVEICQFGVLVNQLQLDGKSAALAQFGKAMAPAAFTFLPFGTLDESDLNSGKSSSNSLSGATANRRLSSSSSSGSDSSKVASQLTGIEKYARQLDVNEDMLFVVTLAGVFCVMASVVGLFGIGYLLAGFVMPRETYLTAFFDKMIGLEVLVAILAQYTIGVTATFQIYYSTKYESITDPKCLLAIAAIIFLAAGILVYGYVVIKKHEAEIVDVGTVQHLKKTVNMRYGPLYEEYKFKNRYFFAAKMMLALTTGVITGCANMSGKIQVALILALNVVFFFYLEIQSPHHSKFVQTTTSFVSIMKIAVLVLTFFLVTAATSDGFPTSLQNGISVAIVGLNLFVLALLMIRSLYAFWQKLKLQRDAAYDQEEQTAQDYFKDETPVRTKDHAPSNAQAPAGQPGSQSQFANLNNNGSSSPYVQGHATVDHASADEIRLRSATHENDDRHQTYNAGRRTAANHYIKEDQKPHSHVRNDVVEL
uniref:TRP C-terminal domain-containing protein n=1 Tax=Hyaloperonospora arabidopsidis (strain Emoy2) TaxID=559515 RepID=M4B1H8_HYAAE